MHQQLHFQHSLKPPPQAPTQTATAVELSLQRTTEVINSATTLDGVTKKYASQSI